MRTTSTLILVAPFLFASGGVVFVHAHLQKSVPPVESTVTQPPTEVAIAFTEAVEPRFRSIGVTNATAQRLDNGQPHIVNEDGKRLAVAV